MNNQNKLLVAVVVALLAVAVPTTVAQTGAVFGSQVKLGDADHIPTTGAASIAVSVKESDLGVATDVSDNCLFIDTAIVAAAGVQNFDLRLTPCQGKASGTLITDADTVEKGSAPATVAGASFRFADVNNNGRYDAGDCVFIRSTATPGIVASSATGTWTVRLTGCSGKAPGSLVYAGDADLVSYGAAATLATSLAWFDADLSAGAAFTSGDNAYILPVSAGALAGSLFTLNSVRASTGNVAGAFGSQVVLGNSDHIPTTSTAAAVNLMQTNGLLRLNLGVTNDINDDCILFNIDTTAATVNNFDIRGTPCQGKAAGTLITDADTVEKGAGIAVGSTAASVRFADVNNNGRYDAGDYLYVVVDETGGIAATGLLTPDVSGGGTNHYTVRVTAAGAKAAGTIVFAGDADFINYGTSASPLGLSGVRIAWFDADLSALGAFTSGDNAYLAPGTIGTSALFPINSVRITSGNDAGAYGTQTKQGDRDHIVVTGAASATVSVLTLDLGVVGDVSDNCFILETGAVGVPAANFDIRLTACQGKAAGTLITDADTVEKGAVTASVSPAAMLFADVNNNGRYDSGDYVYVCESATLHASTGTAVWCVRLTATGAAHGSKAAGSLVFAGDADLTAFGIATVGAFSLAWYDADLSTGAAFTTGDSAYLLPTAPLVAPGSLFQLNSIRLGGPALIANPNQGGPTTTGPTTTGPTTTGPTTTGPTTTSTSTATTTTTTSGSDPGATTTKTKTPGFELVALVAALGAALILVRRKL